MLQARAPAIEDAMTYIIENSAAAEKAAFKRDVLDDPGDDNGRPTEATVEAFSNVGASAEAPNPNNSTEALGNASKNAVIAANLSPPDALKIAGAMVAFHQSPTPLKPNGKGAFLTAWPQRAARNLAAVKEGIASFGANCNVGNVNGKPIDDEREWFHVDIDVKASKDGKRGACTLDEAIKELEAKIGVELPETVMALTPSGGAHLHFWTTRGTYAGNAQYKVTPRVEFPGQIVAPGSVVDGHAYTWADGRAPGRDNPFRKAPQALVDLYIAARRSKGKAAARGSKGKAERTGDGGELPSPVIELDRPDKLAEMRAWLRDDAPGAIRDRSATCKVVSTCFTRFAASRDEVIEALMEPGGWNETKADPPWELDGDDGDDGGNLHKLVYDLYDRRTKAPGSSARVDIDEVFEAVEGVDSATVQAEEADDGEGLDTFSFGGFEGLPIPETPWLVRGMLIDQNVSIINGDGGVGKSWLALQLAICAVTGRQWLGKDVKRGPVLLFSAEDNVHDLHRRAAKILRAEGLTFAEVKDLHGFDATTINAVLGGLNGSGKVKATALWRRVERKVAEMLPSAVFIDTLANVFDGSEINRTQAVQFLGRGDDLRNGGFSRRGESDLTLILGDRRWIATGFEMTSGSGLRSLCRAAGRASVARAHAATPEYVEACRRRKKVEMLFAHLKRILRLTRLRLRGPNGARDEFLLAATAQNLRRLARLRPINMLPEMLAA